MAEIKSEIETMTPREYRQNKNKNIENILRKHQAWDAGLSVQGNLELLDVIAFALADFYQQYRNRLFFSEDILRKQYEELDVLERTEARKNINKRRMLLEKNSSRTHDKTKFELMAEDMGMFFEPEQNENEQLNPENEKELFILKKFLKENGIETKYLNKIQDFSEVHKQNEENTDKQFEDSQKLFGN